MLYMSHTVFKTLHCLAKTSRRYSKLLITICLGAAFIGISYLEEDAHYDILKSEFKKDYVPYQKGNIYPSDEDINQLRNSKRIILKNIMPVFSQHDYQYIHRPKACDFPGDVDKTVLILVKSAARNQELRDAIRLTWASVKQDNLRVLFMLAYNNTEMQIDIDQEASDYGDIVQENFKDAYLNNTLKTVMSYNYAVDHCPNSRYILFIDDDFFLDIRKFLEYTDKLFERKESNVFEGFLLRSRVDRNRESKWFITWDEYPFPRFPPYLAGGAYLASIDIVKRFKRAFPYIKHIGVDDAWLGIVAKLTRVIPSENVYFHNVGKYAHLSLIRLCSHDPNDMFDTWNSYLKNGTYHDMDRWRES